MAIARQRLARRILHEVELCGDEASYHIWVRLPEHWTSEGYALEARMRGVGISTASIFSLSRTSPNGVRLCLCAPADRASLESALIRLAEILHARPNSNFGIV